MTSCSVMMVFSDKRFVRYRILRQSGELIWFFSIDPKVELLMKILPLTPKQVVLRVSGFWKGSHHPDFEDRMIGALVTGTSVAVDGNTYTGQGQRATFDLEFILAEDLAGKEAVERIKKAICYKE